MIKWSKFKMIGRVPNIDMRALSAIVPPRRATVTVRAPVDELKSACERYLERS
jgi:hypothetical protein